MNLANATVFTALCAIWHHVQWTGSVRGVKSDLIPLLSSLSTLLGKRNLNFRSGRGKKKANHHQQVRSHGFTLTFLPLVSLSACCSSFEMCFGYSKKKCKYLTWSIPHCHHCYLASIYAGLVTQLHCVHCLHIVLFTWLQSHFPAAMAHIPVCNSSCAPL